jgi:hypothetical protein
MSMHLINEVGEGIFIPWSLNLTVTVILVLNQNFQNKTGTSDLERNPPNFVEESVETETSEIISDTPKFETLGQL